MKLTREFPSPSAIGFQSEHDYDIGLITQKLAAQFTSESKAFPVEYISLLFLSQNLAELIEFSHDPALDPTGSNILSLHIGLLLRAYGLLTPDSIDEFAKVLENQLESYIFSSKAISALDYLEFWSLVKEFSDSEKKCVSNLTNQLINSVQEAKVLDTIFSRRPFLKTVFGGQDPAIKAAEQSYSDNGAHAYKLMDRYAKVCSFLYILEC